MPDPIQDGLCLTAEDFPGFYRAVHGHEPFPWQVDLLTRVLTDGSWPDLVDVPTGLGKTSVIDIAVFVAAATATTTTADRLGRRRCFFVVDRRIVVDEAHQHALQIRDALRTAHTHSGDVVARVHEGLRSYAPQAGGDVLTVTAMRGGTTWDAAWMDRPDRPAIVLGTIDQVGSRFLFRGYGLSPRRYPIDAAIVGTDALVLADEAHLSSALLSTVAAAQDRDQLGIPVPGLHVIQLSATPGGRSDNPAHPANVYRLNVADHGRHPEATRRLRAQKRLTCVSTTARRCGAEMNRTVIEHLVDLAASENASGAPTALVVCNTVDRAREVHALLQRATTGRRPSLEADCELLIGRSRPADRPHLQDRLLARFGVSRPPSERAGILVATQTVEVGINLDVDVLVSEAASWDALVQRLGRLNRLGRFTQRFPAWSFAPAVIIHDGQENGPVYGPARDATWRTLRQLVEQRDEQWLNVSPLACRELSHGPFQDPEYSRHATGVPLLLTPTLESWTQTAPVPLNDPPIEAFLHGFSSGPSPVQIAWREAMCDDTGTESAAKGAVLVTAMPPRAAEFVEVPLTAARRWLLGQTPPAVGDLEVESEQDSGRTTTNRESFTALAWRPDNTPAWARVSGDQLRPGDQIIVACERGGLDEYGWAPTHTDPTLDVSEPVSFAPTAHPRPAGLRIDQGLPARLNLTPAATVAYEAILDSLEDDEVSTEHAATQLGVVLNNGLPPSPAAAAGWTDATWERLMAWSQGQLRLAPVHGHDVAAKPAGGLGYLLLGPVPGTTVAAAGTRDAGQVERDDEESTTSSLARRPVGLAHHLDAVRRRAGNIARALHLPDHLTLVLEDAARWHDLGKVEPRFQIMLHGGDRIVAAIAAEPLAKSGIIDRDAARIAHKRSELPVGARHEAWSLALLQEHLVTNLRDYPGDVDLLLHLVASHHGHARPFLPLVVDPTPRLVEAVIDGARVSIRSERTVCLDHPVRFANLNQRYGRWGLALLETVVRCADMTVSEEGS